MPSKKLRYVCACLVILVGSCGPSGDLTQLAPLEQAAAINTISEDLRRVFTNPFVSPDWRNQLDNLMGMALRFSSKDVEVAAVRSTPGMEIQLRNPKSYLGPNKELLQAIRVQETSDNIYTITVDRGFDSNLSAVLGTAGLKEKQVEKIEITSTVSMSFKELNRYVNPILDKIRGELLPGQVALWITGFAVYRLRYSSYAEMEGNGSINVGALSVNGKVYNKQGEDRLTYRIFPTAIVISTGVSGFLGDPINLKGQSESIDKVPFFNLKSLKIPKE